MKLAFQLKKGVDETILQAVVALLLFLFVLDKCRPAIGQSRMTSVVRERQQHITIIDDVIASHQQTSQQRSELVHVS
eukprot:scaffold3073_cov66-Cylindrotheca_fusiformis.AAC.5